LALPLVLAFGHGARAGAFMEPEGQGQFIAGVGYTEGSRRFDQNGRTVAAPSFRKAEAGFYLEYGLTSWLSLVLAPTLSDAHEAANSVTGSDSSAFGARLQIYGAPGQVIAVQALAEPPLGAGSRATQVADGGARTLGVDARLLFGQDFPLFGLPAFADIEPGAHVRADPFPTEARLDVTLGIRARPNLLVLVQDFSSAAPSSGPLIPRQSYSKVQVSAVYDLSPRWSVQVGAVRTIAGRDAARETGPLGGLWYRF
jgi:hypothetical protein